MRPVEQVAQVLRKTISIIGGVAIGLAITLLLEQFIQFIYPPPPGTNIHDPKVAEELMQNTPAWVMGLVLSAYALGAFAAGITTSVFTVRKKNIYPIVAGIIFMLLGTAGIIMVRHPMWFTIASFFYLCSICLPWTFTDEKVSD